MPVTCKLTLATLKTGGGGYPFCARLKISNGYPGWAEVYICPLLGIQKEIGGYFASKVTDLCVLT